MGVGLEATGTYSLPLASALHAAGHTVFVCNPLSLARYSQAVLARTKTDPADARRIARFCAAHDLVTWSPASPAHRRLHALVATRAILVRELQALRNRQGAAAYAGCEELLAELQAPVLEALAAQIARIDRELAELAAAETPLGAQLRLLTSIPGPGLITAATLVASLPLERLPGPRQVAAYVRAAGKRPKVVIAAVMRKLLLLAWAILRSGRPYSPTHRSARPAPAVA